MKAIITVLAFGLFAVPAFAQTTEDTQPTTVADVTVGVSIITNTNPGDISVSENITVADAPIGGVVTTKNSGDTSVSGGVVDSVPKINTTVIVSNSGDEGVSITDTNTTVSTDVNEEVVDNGNNGSNGGSKQGGKAKNVSGLVLGVETHKFVSNLWKGLKSDDVKELQARLRAEGYFTFPTNTGYFGPITFAAVQAYQAAHGIWNTGFVGNITRAALNK